MYDEAALHILRMCVGIDKAEKIDDGFASFAEIKQWVGEQKKNEDDEELEGTRWRPNTDFKDEETGVAKNGNGDNNDGNGDGGGDRDGNSDGNSNGNDNGGEKNVVRADPGLNIVHTYIHATGRNNLAMGVGTQDDNPYLAMADILCQANYDPDATHDEPLGEITASISNQEVEVEESALGQDAAANGVGAIENGRSDPSVAKKEEDIRPLG